MVREENLGRGGGGGQKHGVLQALTTTGLFPGNTAEFLCLVMLPVI